MITASYLISSVVVLYSKPSLGALALYHFLFSWACISNFITVTVYWSVLYKADLARPEVQADPVRMFLSHSLHLIPGLTLAWTFRWQRVVMRFSDYY